MRHAIEDLKLNRLAVIHAGDEIFSLEKKIRAVALRKILNDLKPLGYDSVSNKSQDVHKNVSSLEKGVKIIHHKPPGVDILSDLFR